MSLGRWDYLLLSASNAAQARLFERQVQVRRDLGLLEGVEECLVVADPNGRRIGSGGSTFACVMRVLERELKTRPDSDGSDPALWLQALSELRILLIHAGGDSRRLPAYAACGKLFAPVPVPSDSALPTTLFDVLLPAYAPLADADADGQLLLASGDVFLGFDPHSVRFGAGVTGVGVPVPPEIASRHGVYVSDTDGNVTRFLQKPTVDELAAAGAIGADGRAIVDTGLLNFDAASLCRLLQACGVAGGTGNRFDWSGAIGAAIDSIGFDLYREFACALGSATSRTDYEQAVIAAGSRWSCEQLKRFYEQVSAQEYRVVRLPQAEFLHLGTTRQLLSDGRSAARFVQRRRGGDAGALDDERLSINNRFSGDGNLSGGPAWVEGCRIEAPLALGGDNVVVGLDVTEPLELPRFACLDLAEGVGRSGASVHFVRCYHVDDPSACAEEESPVAGETFCGVSLSDWLSAVGAGSADVWPATVEEKDRSVWNARLFPAEEKSTDYGNWLWMFDPAGAGPEAHASWRQADRYSLAEMARLVDGEKFLERRQAIRNGEVLENFGELTRAESGFTADDLACVLRGVDDPVGLVGKLLSAVPALDSSESDEAASDVLPLFDESRRLHTIGTAVASLPVEIGAAVDRLRDASGWPGLESLRSPGPCSNSTAGRSGDSLRSSPGHPSSSPGHPNAALADSLKREAFRLLRQKIVASNTGEAIEPAKPIGRDETVRGRAPVRIDLGGGWTDTPPYALEFGGCVLNAAVKLSGRLPVEVAARRLDEPMVRLVSIDEGKQIEITRFAELGDCCDPQAEFSLSKAVLLQCCGMSDEASPGNADAFTALLERFGGGVELTTRAHLPRGSGLGTSSIIGSVSLAVLARLLGRSMTEQELFHATLRLEQSLTTGGGWQDQVGGVVGGAKVVSSAPGLVPQLDVEPVSSSTIDPRENGGQTLLYFTGVTRLAKNILDQVVGRYLNRERRAMRTLSELRQLPAQLADAMTAGRFEEFGRLVGRAWELNKRLDPSSTNEEVEKLVERIEPHAWGAKLLGAGGGGFLFIVGKSPEHAQRICTELENDPPNAAARFYEFEVSGEGLTVEVLRRG